MKPRSTSVRSGRRPDGRAFTLLEVLIVLGLIAVLSVWAWPALAGGSQAAALQSAQATVATFVAAARTKAVATGSPVRILLNIDPAGTPAEGRYLRYLVLQVRAGTGWETAGDAWLPDGTAVVPRDPGNPANLLAAGQAWTRPSDGSPLRSTVLRAVGPLFPEAEVNASIGSTRADLWASITFSALGTTANSGDLVIAAWQVLSPGSYAAGQSPGRFGNQALVRGLSLSTYGLPQYINERAGF